VVWSAAVRCHDVRRLAEKDGGAASHRTFAILRQIGELDSIDQQH
jgi:hypothetical protein